MKTKTKKEILNHRRRRWWWQKVGKPRVDQGTKKHGTTEGAVRHALKKKNKHVSCLQAKTTTNAVAAGKKAHKETQITGEKSKLRHYRTIRNYLGE